MTEQLAPVIPLSDAEIRVATAYLKGDPLDPRGSWLCIQAEKYAKELSACANDDRGNAQRFLLLHGDGVRFCEALGGWLRWDGCRWLPDALAIERLAGDVQALLVAEADRSSGSQRNDLLRHAARAGSAGAARELLWIARSLAAAPVEDFDARPGRLNFLNGTLDLDRGEFGEAFREDLLTQAIPHRFDPEAVAPRWAQFIAEATRGDAELAAYLQRAAGSILLGRVREHRVLVVYGPGGTGKGTFARALLAALGTDYAMEAPPGLLLKHGQDSHPTGLADLYRKRFVVLQEVAQGKEFNLELLKRLSGGDRIRARRLYKDSFEFTPSHHLMLFLNHLPRVRESSRAVWRRLFVLPFENLVPSASMDLDLDDTLAAEAPGILRWLVEGYRFYQRDGLGTCRAVDDATAEYRRESDVLGRFIEEQCVRLPAARVKASAMRAAFNTWAAEQGLPLIDAMSLAEGLREQAIEKAKLHGTMTYLGIGLAVEDG